MFHQEKATYIINNLIQDWGPMAIGNEILNTRDLLLLSQLLEQQYGPQLDYGELVSDPAKMQDLYEELTSHKVYKLSHNEPNETPIITAEELYDVVSNILSTRSILDNCEHYYQKRIIELRNHISGLTDKFSAKAAEVEKRGL